MLSFNVIKMVLVEKWDPLDIGLNAKLHDEYDDIARDILKLAGSHDFRNQVKNMLLSREIDFEIYPVNKERIDQVSDLLAKLVR
jgi:hypothetical protein